MNQVIELVAVIGGALLVAFALADLVNTLVSTYTSYARWWPSRLIGRSTFVAIRSVAGRLPEDSKWRERMLAANATKAGRKRMIVAVARQLAVNWWKIRTGKARPEDFGLEMKSA